MRKPVTAYLGFGGNVGDVKAAMLWAIEEVGRLPGTDVVTVSQLYKTPPWGIKTQNWFLNSCMAVKTTIAPHALLRALIDIEVRAGRVRDLRWGPRTLDIDILTYGDYAIATPGLTIPHPRMLERAFVMAPLADIAPNLVIGGASVQKISDAIRDPQMAVAESAWVT
ncbi:MAG: 2-amino-4-hydroxy-6-hydroxymethyldihydropteridine diphosphokinase [Pseudomonadota bacterium]